MNAAEVIQSYVHDVARQLPRKKRADVAFELRALLADELAAKAEAEGRAPDKAMALSLLTRFGRPAATAVRYHPRAPLIDPADNHHFVIWALAGLVFVVAGGVMSPMETDGGDSFLKWLGLLAIIFALMGWWRRRNPDALGWTPKPVEDPCAANRPVTLLLAVLFLVFPVFMYAAPQTFVETVFLGAFPAGGLELNGFMESGSGLGLRQATIAALGLYAALYVWVTAAGRWRVWTRRAAIINLMAIALLLGAHAPLAQQGLVFVSPVANQTAVPLFALIGAFMVLGAFYEIYREWARVDPAPAMKSGGV